MADTKIPIYDHCIEKYKTNMSDGLDLFKNILEVAYSDKPGYFKKLLDMYNTIDEKMRFDIHTACTDIVYTIGTIYNINDNSSNNCEMSIFDIIKNAAVVAALLAKFKIIIEGYLTICE